MAYVELTREYVVYVAQTKLLELADEVADSNRFKKSEIKAKIQLAKKIGLWVRALEYYEYLDKPTIDKLVYCLADLCDAKATSYVPVVGNIDPPSIIVGGTTIINNNTSTDSEGFINPDVDTGSEAVDSFDISSGRGAFWIYTVRDQADTNQRSGTIVGSWNSTGSSIVYKDESTEDIGTTAVEFSVTYSSPNIILTATATSDNWIVEGRRFIITNG